MEIKLLKATLDRSFYEKAKPFITANQFSVDGQRFYNTVCKAHDKFNTTTITEEEIKALYESDHVLTTAQGRIFKHLIEKVKDEEQPNEEIALTILQKASDKEKMLKIAEVAIRTTNNGADADFSAIQELLEEAGRSVTDTYAAVTTDLTELLSATAPEGRMPLSRLPIHHMLPGVGAGHNIIIHARTEIGKSSLAAAISVGFMEQGKRVDYFCNEEPGNEIMLNHVRARCDMTDEQLQMYPEKAIPIWDEVKDNLTLKDVVGMTLGELKNSVAASKPDVVIVDQTDKILADNPTGKITEDLKKIYCGIREIAKINEVPTFNITQTSAEGEGLRAVTNAMMENSKTGKQAEADVIIGVGPHPEEPDVRYFNFTKNKLYGKHGIVRVNFKADTNQWSIGE